MKMRTIVAVLLAAVLLLTPTAVLAGDPPETVVIIEVTGPGDLEASLTTNVGGDATYYLNDKELGSFMSDIAGSMGGDGDEYTFHLTRANRDNIETLAQNQAVIMKVVGNDHTHEIAALSIFALLKIQEDNWQEIEIGKLQRAVLQFEVQEVQIADLEAYTAWLEGEKDRVEVTANILVDDLEVEVQTLEHRQQYLTYILIVLAAFIAVIGGLAVFLMHRADFTRRLIGNRRP